MMMIFIEITAFSMILKYALSQSCVSFSNENVIGNVCYGAVDYSYYLAANFSSDDYNTIAISKLNSLKLSILPINCQISIKKLVCSQVYLKCPEGINLTSSTYYNWNFNIYFDIYSQLVLINSAYPSVLKSPYIPMPFQRPCQSICTDLSTNCLGLLGLLDIDQNCTARYDYSRGSFSTLYSTFSSLQFPYQYDSSNNHSQCNAMTANFSVASTKEVYLRANDPTGACYGITKELYIPPGQSISASMAPLQLPYVVQSVIESSLTTSFSALPVYLSQSCHLAIKKYLCGSYMMSPQQQVVGRSLQAAGLSPEMQAYLVNTGILQADLLTYSFYLPSYPQESICLEYQTACADFIAAAGLAALVPNCSAVSSSGVLSFPTTNQSLMSLPLTVGSTTLSVSFFTSPNHMSSATSSYTTSCPAGYVVPEEPEDDRVVWVTGSGCAFACQSNLWTSNEWKFLNNLSTILAWIGLIMVLFLLITLVWDEQRKKQFLIFYFALYSSVCTFTFILSTSLPHSWIYCASNAVAYDSTDPINFAQVQAILLTFCGVGSTACWLMLSIDLFLKVGLGFRSTARYKLAYLSFIGVVSGTCSLYASLRAKVGYIGILPVSFVWRDNKGDLISLYTPMLIMAFGGAGCMLVVLSSILKSSLATSISFGSGTDSHRRSSSNSISTIIRGILVKFKMLKIPVLFLLCFFVLILTYQLWRYNFNVIYKKATAGLIVFTACIFTHYDGTDESWISACGHHSEGRPNFAFASWVFACLSGESIVVSGVYLISPSIWRFWARKLFTMFSPSRKGLARYPPGYPSGTGSSAALCDDRFTKNGSASKLPERRIFQSSVKSIVVSRKNNSSVALLELDVRKTSATILAG